MTKITLGDVLNNFDGTWRTDKYSGYLRIAAWFGSIVLIPLLPLLLIELMMRTYIKGIMREERRR